MNKTEFITAVAEEAQMSKVDTRRAIEAFIDVVLSEMKKGEKITLPGFGVFSVIEKGERTGINPQTKEKITIKPHKVVKFKPGSELTESVK